MSGTLQIGLEVGYQKMKENVLYWAKEESSEVDFEDYLLRLMEYEETDDARVSNLREIGSQLAYEAEEEGKLEDNELAHNLYQRIANLADEDVLDFSYKEMGDAFYGGFKTSRSWIRLSKNLE